MTRNSTSSAHTDPVETGSPDSGDVEAATLPPPERNIFCNRTLNLRGIRAIGYDMDYTLVHYNVRQWERRAYEYLRGKLVDQDWPVADLEFDSSLVIRGLIIDRELGNILKANRFGYVKVAAHGTQMLGFDEQKRVYARTIVDLSEDRWVFLNTLFSLSEAVMYAQLVDMHDENALQTPMSYADLYDVVRSTLDETHVEGQLKADIIADPERFVELDPEAAQALWDQRQSGKKLVLITNSDWDYTRRMMEYTFDRYLPGNMGWRDLFDLVVTSARKPEFFSSRTPIFKVIDDDGRLELSSSGITEDGDYVAGHAALIESYLGLDGDDILYVGDHIYGDVHASKSVRRWRTALVLRELEREVRALEAFHDRQARLSDLMEDKIRLEHQYAVLRLKLQRVTDAYGPRPAEDADTIQTAMHQIRSRIGAIDEHVAPLARASGELMNPRWGPLMRTGNDKSHLARQLERHADIYMSRISNFLYETPFVYLRSPRGSLPHDPGWTPSPWDDGSSPTDG